jgi:DNA-binding MarR family transcriptional regulator
MISPEDGTRRLDAQPWEPLGRSFDGRGGFSDSRSLGAAALALQAPRYAVQPSRATSELKSGLTRRGIIYEYIRTHPGVHVRGMAKELRLATGDLQYHLLWLERHGFVKTKKSGFYRFVYPTMVFKEEQEVLLGVLSQETPREILLSLLRDAGTTQGELARSLGCSQPTISWHMDRLVQLGVVGKKRTSREIVYEVTADREDILRFVKDYHREVWKKWVGRLSSSVVSAGGKRVEKGRPMQRAGLFAPAVVELIGKR